MGFGFLNALTSFATGAAEGENQQFDRVYKEQKKQDDITQQLVGRAALDVQKRQDDAAKRLQFKRGVMQVYGIDDAQADAVADLPEDARKDPEKLGMFIRNMRPIEGQTVPATQQTQQVIRAPQRIKTGFLTPDINIPAVSVPHGEDQPERQAYSVNPSPDLNFPKFPMALDPEQAEAQRKVYAAYQAGPNAIAALDPAILQKAHSQFNIEHEGQAMSQIIAMKQHGTTNPDGSQYDYNAHYKAMTGHAPRIDLNAMTIPTNESQKSTPQKIKELIEAHPEKVTELGLEGARQWAADIVLGVTKPMQGEGGNLVEVNQAKGTQTPLTQTGPITPSKEQQQSSQAAFASLTNAGVMQKHLQGLIEGNPNMGGIPGHLSDKAGGLVAQLAGMLNAQAGNWVDKVTNASKNQEFRRGMESLISQMAAPLQSDRSSRYVSKEEFSRAEDIVGASHKDEWWHSPEQIVADLKSLNEIRLNAMYKHMNNIPALQPPQDLVALSQVPAKNPDPAKGINTMADEYKKVLIDQGRVDSADANALMRRIVNQQAGRGATGWQ